MPYSNIDRAPLGVSAPFWLWAAVLALILAWAWRGRGAEELPATAPAES